MKKRTAILSLVFIFCVGAISYAAINGLTVRYYNKDSKTYVFNVKIAGSSTQVEFGGSRTASVSIQGGSSSAVISCNCGDVTVKDGNNIEISNGCISVK